MVRQGRCLISAQAKILLTFHFPFSICDLALVTAILSLEIELFIVISPHGEKLSATTTKAYSGLQMDATCGKPAVQYDER